MKTAATLVVALVLFVSGLASSQGIYRSDRKPLDQVTTLTAAQKKEIAKISAKYGDELAAWQKQHKNSQDAPDDLNRRFTKALLAEMSKTQRKVYLQAIYRHVQDFLKTHPDMTFDEVFVWGGAYMMKPDKG